MIDFHVHTLFSDGSLIPSELVARAKDLSYIAFAITDHADGSNVEEVLKKTVRFVETMDPDCGLTVVAGVELTHIHPKGIAGLTREARNLGARVVVCHGETITEPVCAGTNRAAIEAGVDVLAHPGLVGEAEARLAAERGVLFEITTRKGHSLTNGHVAAMAKRFGVELILNTDTHSPEDLVTADYARRVALGAGLGEDDYEKIKDNARRLLRKVSG
ncbi:MAG: histidinol phosphate phosphatase domain-containing protein [Deltaproteobacteria bacterium]|nr:histidinol phosphate phosphatase domain-containing protein [Deltaproteobacteria bacterium]